MIQFEREICKYMGIPSIPLKKWDKKSSFKNGVAVTTLMCDHKAYAVCTFDAEVDKEPRIKKVFSYEPFSGIEDIFVVPEYMDLDTKHADLDDESKEAAERLAQEAKAVEEKNEEEKAIDEMEKLPEWVFDEIHNADEAQAWLRNYRQRNGIKKGRLPQTEEGLKMSLLNIYSTQKKRK